MAAAAIRRNAFVPLGCAAVPLAKRTIRANMPTREERDQNRPKSGHVAAMVSPANVDVFLGFAAAPFAETTRGIPKNFAIARWAANVSVIQTNALVSAVMSIRCTSPARKTLTRDLCNERRRQKPDQLRESQGPLINRCRQMILYNYNLDISHISRKHRRRIPSSQINAQRPMWPPAVLASMATAAPACLDLASAPAMTLNRRSNDLKISYGKRAGH